MSIGSIKIDPLEGGIANVRELLGVINVKLTTVNWIDVS